jgi:Transglutaminase-like superfamily/Coenzyme PQQ synthesis protein D (PqqD)
VKRHASDLVVSRVVAGRTLLLNVETGTYLTLSASGTRLWELRQLHGDGAAIRLASAEYDVSEEVVHADLKRMLGLVATLRARRRRPRWSPPAIPSCRRLVAVPLGDWPSLALTVCLAAGVELGLRFLSLSRLAVLAGMSLAFDDAGQERPAHPRPPAGTLTTAQARRIRATDRVYAVWPLGDTCLRRALVLGCHLRRDRPRLRIGVSATPPVGAPGAPGSEAAPSITAHAWVETSAVTLLALAGFESLVAPVQGRRS